MRLRIKQARSTDFNETIKCAVEIRAYAKAETENSEYSRTIGNSDTKSEISELTRLIKNLGKEMAFIKEEINSVREKKFKPQQDKKRPHYQVD